MTDACRHDGKRRSEYVYDAVGRSAERVWCECGELLSDRACEDPACDHKERRLRWTYRSIWTGFHVSRWACDGCGFAWNESQGLDAEGAEGREARFDALEDWLDRVERGID